MAAPDTPSAMFRALRSVNVDPDLAYQAAEEMHHEAGQNIIAVLGAQIDVLKAEIKAETTEIRADLKAQAACIDALGNRIDSVDSRVTMLQESLGSRIDTLQRVIWPLIVILATSVFGLLYKAITG